jgi:hypothetical protein
MGVTIVKKETTKAQSKAKLSTQEDLAQRVDLAGKAHDEVEAIKMQLRDAETKLKDAKDALKPEIQGLEGPQTLILHGNTCTLEVGAEGNTRAVQDKQALIKFLNKVKPGLFEQLAAVKMTDIDKYLNPEQQDACVGKKGNGRRNWKFAFKN